MMNKMLANTSHAEVQFKFGSWGTWLLYIALGVHGNRDFWTTACMHAYHINVLTQHTDLENSSGDNADYYSAAEDLSNEPDVRYMQFTYSYKLVTTFFNFTAYIYIYII